MATWQDELRALLAVRPVTREAVFKVIESIELDRGEVLTWPELHQWMLAGFEILGIIAAERPKELIDAAIRRSGLEP